jgi:IS5 family transposase
MVRKHESKQLQFGQVAIEGIKFNLHCRDEMTKVLLGLQYMHADKDLMLQIYTIMESSIANDISKGRLGMSLWQILVIGMVRLCLNADYDRLLNECNHHAIMRSMLGHGYFDQEAWYSLQTIKDNVRLLSVDVLDEINRVIVTSGRSLLPHGGSGIEARCDSFVVETNVHYPTDANLLYDAMRCLIRSVGRLCIKHDVQGWRQYRYHISHLKKSLRHATNIRHSTSKDYMKQQQRRDRKAEAYTGFMLLCQEMYDKVAESAVELEIKMVGNIVTPLDGILEHMVHAERQLNQLHRRVVLKEKIPHKEKVFSIFEPHTEWISKGKAGVPFELGRKVCIASDQHGFILHHKVVTQQTDDALTTRMVEGTLERYSAVFDSWSFDRGFYSADNVTHLKGLVAKLVMPKKGRLSAADKLVEHDKAFILLKNKHSAVESDINSLERHGLDRCLDKGPGAFDRYVALAILSHNVHKIGALLLKKQQKDLRKKERLKAAA